MSPVKRAVADAAAPVIDLLLLPFVIPAAFLLKTVRRIGLHRLPGCRVTLLRIGLIPVRNHYHEPFVSMRQLAAPLDQERLLPGIDWNVDEQLALLAAMRHSRELADLDKPSDNPMAFRLGNGSFESGDAEYLYQLVRLKRPRRVFEIGSGNSTRLVRQALARNLEEDHITCRHVCIEPFEAPWLERLGASIVRKRLEELDRSMFNELEENDILFIDSSHIIRPQGDVLVEFLEILPSLNPGVIVHVHDIFSPRDYPTEWVTKEVRLWNEQYLLEAFLSATSSWKVIGALNLLRHRHFDALRAACPHLTRDREPGSFYIQKIECRNQPADAKRRDAGL